MSRASLFTLLLSFPLLSAPYGTRYNNIRAVAIESSAVGNQFARRSGSVSRSPLNSEAGRVEVCMNFEWRGITVSCRFRSPHNNDRDAGHRRRSISCSAETDRSEFARERTSLRPRILALSYFFSLSRSLPFSFFLSLSLTLCSTYPSISLSIFLPVCVSLSLSPLARSLARGRVSHRDFTSQNWKGRAHRPQSRPQTARFNNKVIARNKHIFPFSPFSPLRNYLLVFNS